MSYEYFVSDGVGSAGAQDISKALDPPNWRRSGCLDRLPLLGVMDVASIFANWSVCKRHKRRHWVCHNLRISIEVSFSLRTPATTYWDRASVSDIAGRSCQICFEKLAITNRSSWELFAHLTNPNSLRTDHLRIHGRHHYSEHCGGLSDISSPAFTGMSVGALRCWSFKRSKAFGVFWNTKVSFVIETLPFLAWKGWVEVVSRILGTGMILLILHTFSGYAGFSGSTMSLIFMPYTAAKKFWLCLSRIIEIYSDSNTQGMLN